jgi:Na+/phosphate symporter
MILTVAAIVMIVGILMYALCTNPKLAEVGRIMFAVGLLVLLWNIGGAWVFPTRH